MCAPPPTVNAPRARCLSGALSLPLARAATRARPPTTTRPSHRVRLGRQRDLVEVDVGGGGGGGGRLLLFGHHDDRPQPARLALAVPVVRSSGESMISITSSLQAVDRFLRTAARTLHSSPAEDDCVGDCPPLRRAGARSARDAWAGARGNHAGGAARAMHRPAAGGERLHDGARWEGSMGVRVFRVCCAHWVLLACSNDATVSNV